MNNQIIRKINLYLYLHLFCILTFSCNKIATTSDTSFYLTEPCMLVNTEANNTIEGNYLKVFKGGSTNTITLNAMPNIDTTLLKKYDKWVLGWGSGKPYYDGGVENLCEIVTINFLTKTIVLGKIIKGKTYPPNNKYVVFWNRFPSDFINTSNRPIIDETMGWKGLSDNSISFNTIIKTDTCFIMYIHETDCDTISIFAAWSKNLHQWNVLNNGLPVLTADNFKNCWWAGYSKKGRKEQAAVLSDIIYKNSTWYYYMDGYDSLGLRHIGLATTNNPLSFKFQIYANPVLSPNNNSWDEKACYFGKIVFNGKQYLMYYNGIDSKNTERIGLAVSNNLLDWKKYNNNPIIDDHTGWRSCKRVSEPAYVSYCNGKIYLLIAGAKAFRDNYFFRYILKNSYMLRSGNVDDTQLGLYISTDGGYRFLPHANNPIFINNYTIPYENEHLGAFFKIITHNDSLFLFYQAKTSAYGKRYLPFLRVKTIIKNDFHHND